MYDDGDSPCGDLLFTQWDTRHLGRGGGGGGGRGGRVGGVVGVKCLYYIHSLQGPIRYKYIWYLLLYALYLCVSEGLDPGVGLQGSVGLEVDDSLCDVDLEAALSLGGAGRVWRLQLCHLLQVYLSQLLALLRNVR